MLAQSSSRPLSLNASPANEGRTAEDLVRAVRDHIAEFHPERLSSSTEEIILDLDVDDSRYLLVRMPRAETRIQLSPREHEIARMVAQGLSNKVIAGVLEISSWTVCSHLRRIFAKFGVGSRAAMVARLYPRSGNAPVAERIPVATSVTPTARAAQAASR
jgi:DNA-binding CsgD family transcriptional regulator